MKSLAFAVSFHSATPDSDRGTEAGKRQMQNFRFIVFCD